MLSVMRCCRSPWAAVGAALSPHLLGWCPGWCGLVLLPLPGLRASASLCYDCLAACKAFMHLSQHAACMGKTCFNTTLAAHSALLL